MPNTTTLASLAGLLDADGSFMIKRHTYHVRVRGDARCALFSERIGIKQVRPEAIEFLHSVFPGSRSRERGYTRHASSTYGWQVTDAKAAKVAAALLPYLLIKRAQAEILLALRSHKSLGRKALRQPDGTTFPWRHWTGKTIAIRRFIMKPEAIAYRQSLFEQ